MKATILISLIALASCMMAQEAYNEDDNQVILYENFDVASVNWYHGETENYIMANRNGKYYIESKTTDGIYITSNIDILGAYRDFMFEAEIKLGFGEPQFAYGMIYGYKDNKTFFSYEIGETGYFRILQFDEGKSIPLVNWTTTDAIRPGSVNTLSVFKIGDALYYSINHVLVSKLKYMGYYGLKLGFIVYNKQAIEIDDLLAKKLTNSEVSDITEGFMAVDKELLFDASDDEFTKQFKTAFAQTFTAANQRFINSVSEVVTEYQFEFITNKYTNLASLYPLAKYGLLKENVYETVGETKYSGAQEVSIFFDCRDHEDAMSWNDAIFDETYSKIYKALMACKNAKIGGDWEVVYQEPNTSGTYHRENLLLMPRFLIMQSKKLPGLSVYAGPKGHEGVYLNFIVP
jgi:hypothetical protein